MLGGALTGDSGSSGRRFQTMSRKDGTTMKQGKANVHHYIAVKENDVESEMLSWHIFLQSEILNILLADYNQIICCCCCCLFVCLEKFTPPPWQEGCLASTPNISLSWAPTTQAWTSGEEKT